MDDLNTFEESHYDIRNWNNHDAELEVIRIFQEEIINAINEEIDQELYQLYRYDVKQKNCGPI